MKYIQWSIILFITANSAAFSQNQDIIVIKKDSIQISGTLISISPEKVVVKTESIVSKLIVNADEIAKVRFIDTDEDIVYPIQNTETLSKFGYVPQKIKQKKDYPIRRWSILVQSGVGNSFFSTELEDIDVDYKCKNLFEFSFRWHKPVEYRKKAGKLMEFSYYHEGLRARVESSDFSFIKKVSVHSFAFDYGFNSGDLGRNSYIFITGGFSVLMVPDNKDSGLKPNYFGMRINLGTVQGVIPRLSIQLKILFDLAIVGFGQNTGIAAYNGGIYETYEPGIHPNYDGGSMNFMAGIMVDL